MRVKRGYRTGSKDSYNLFCSRNKHLNISFEIFKKILYRFNQLIVDHIFHTGEVLKLPYGIGPIVVNKSKVKKTKTFNGVTRNTLPIDWKLTKQEGTIVRTLNMHTDGYKFNVAWFPKNSRIKCAIVWSFKIERSHARKLAYLLKDSTAKFKDIYQIFIKK